jgi:hypothetical protein
MGGVLPRRLVLPCVAVWMLGGLLAAGAASAASSTIAGASAIAPHALTVGGGQPVDFFRIALHAGDEVDVTYDMLGQQGCGYLYLFAPTVNDFSIRQSQPVSSANVKPGSQSVQLVSPFNGTGTLAISIDPSLYFSDLAGSDTINYPPLASPLLADGCQVVTPYSTSYAVVHLTRMTLGHVAARVSSPRRHFRVAARVESPAGVPVGSCRFERLVRGVATRVAEATVRHGVCSASVSVGADRRAAFRVSFQGSSWQPAQATSRTVIVRAAH